MPANWPRTPLGIMPEQAGPENRVLIVRWGGLHAARSAPAPSWFSYGRCTD